MQVKKVLQNAPIEHSAILLTCIKLPSVIKTFVVFIFEWPLKTGFTLCLFPGELYAEDAITSVSFVHTFEQRNIF